MLGELSSAVTSVTDLIQSAKAAKEFFDGDQLCVTVNNEGADRVILDSFLCDDISHSSKALTHKDTILMGESDSGLFKVNVISESDTSFLYTIEHKGIAYELLINYNWSTQSTASGEISLKSREETRKWGLVLFKRTWLVLDDNSFRVSVFATGKVMTVSILPQL